MASHRYSRQFDPSSGNSLALLAERIPPGATLLELGPAAGYFTQHLHENLGCTIDAVELDPSMADAARVWCRTMLVGNLETLDLTSALPAAAYDMVLMADVLEHLRDPLPLLRQLHRLLKPGGCCLISVPNIAYGGVVASLLGGEFEYRSEGLLDRTHLRFYTQRSLAHMLQSAGWFAHAWQAVRLPYWESEFRTRLEVLPRALADMLRSRPELSCYQWLVEARAAAPASPAEPCPADDVWPGERFPIRLFWGNESETFDYCRSLISWGRIGESRKVEEFVLDADTNATRLRLRLADRPGFLRLYSVTVQGAAQENLWQWTAAEGANALAEAFFGLELADAGEHTLVLLKEAESWLDLAWRGTPEARVYKVFLSFSWPESADFTAARTGWEGAVQPLRSALDTVKMLVAARDEALVARDALLHAQGEHLEAQARRLLAQDEHLAAQQARLVAQQDELQTLQASHEALGRELFALRQGFEAQTTTLQNQIARMQTFSWWLKQPLRWLRQLT